MMIAGPEQLNLCPILERAAMVDSTELVISSRNLQVSRFYRRLIFKEKCLE